MMLVKALPGLGSDGLYFVLTTEHRILPNPKKIINTSFRSDGASPSFPFVPFSKAPVDPGIPIIGVPVNTQLHTSLPNVSQVNIVHSPLKNRQ